MQKITLQKRINLILALRLSVQAEAPYRKNLHPDRALTDKYTLYYNMQITILDECSVLILYFHTLNFTITFSTFFHCLSHHFVYFSLLTQVRVCWNKIYIVIVNYGSYGLIILWITFLTVKILLLSGTAKKKKHNLVFYLCIKSNKTAVSFKKQVLCNRQSCKQFCISLCFFLSKLNSTGNQFGSARLCCENE